MFTVKFIKDASTLHVLNIHHQDSRAPRNRWNVLLSIFHPKKVSNNIMRMGGLNGMDGLRYNIYNISTFYLVRYRSFWRGGCFSFSVCIEIREIRTATRTKHVNSIKNLFEMVLTLWRAQCTCFTVVGSKSYDLSLNLKSLSFSLLHFILSFTNILRWNWISVHIDSQITFTAFSKLAKGRKQTRMKNST